MSLTDRMVQQFVGETAAEGLEAIGEAMVQAHEGREDELFSALKRAYRSHPDFAARLAKEKRDMAARKAFLLAVCKGCYVDRDCNYKKSGMCVKCQQAMTRG